MTVRTLAAEVDIQKLREKQRITRTALALKTGLSSGYIKVVEKRKAKPSPDAVQKITSALSIPFEKIYKAYRPGERVPAPDEIVPRKKYKRQKGEGMVGGDVLKEAEPPTRLPDQEKALSVLATECRAAADDSIRTLFAFQSGADIVSLRESLRGVMRHLILALGSTVDFGDAVGATSSR